MKQLDVNDKNKDFIMFFFSDLPMNAVFIQHQNHLFCRLNRPLTLSEKILYSHLDDPANQVQ